MSNIAIKASIVGVACVLFVSGCGGGSEIPSVDAASINNNAPSIPAVIPGQTLPPPPNSVTGESPIGNGLVSVESPSPTSTPIYGPTVPSPTVSPSTSSSSKPGLAINKVNEITLGMDGNMLLSTDTGIWKTSKIPGSDTNFTASLASDIRWNVTSLTHDMANHIYYSSGYADTSKDATSLGLLGSGDSGRNWEVLGLGKQIAFGALSSGPTKDDGTFIIGVDLKSGVLVLSKNGGRGDWFQGPDGSYSSVAVSKNRMFALDIKDSKLWYSDYTGEGWSYIAWPKYVFMFPSSDESGRLFFIEPEKNELYVLDKFDVKKGDELYKNATLVGELPSKGTVVSGVVSEDMIMLLIDQDLFVSYDGGKTFKQVTVTLK